MPRSTTTSIRSAISSAPPIFTPGLLRPKGGSKIDEATTNRWGASPREAIRPLILIVAPYPRQSQKLARRRQQILMRQDREVRRRQGLQIVSESVRHARRRIAFPPKRKPKMRKIVDPSPLRRRRPTHHHHRPR
jgi:hypothetical protein